MNGRTMFWILAALPITATASAQPPVAWNFAKGQVLEFERVGTQKQSVQVNGKQFKQDRKSTWHVRLDVTGKQDDHFLILATLTKVKQKVNGATDAELIDAKLAERMEGSKFTLEVTPDGRIVMMQGYDDFLNRLADKDAGRLKALRVTFPEPAVKEMLADLFGPLPSKKGAGWRREYVEPIPHFGKLRSTASYKYADGPREKIVYTIQTKYEPPPKDDRMAFFRIVKGTIDADKAVGAIVFDKAAGHLVQHDRSMSLRGALTIESMDRQQSLEFSSESEVKIRFLSPKR